MVSLAFVLAFIGASVALLIGIIIFSEVENDMSQTFGDELEITNESDGVWSWREHSSTPFGSMISDAQIEVASPNRAVIISTEFNTYGITYFFKSFPIELIEDKDVKLKYQITTSGTSVPKCRFQLVDGAYDRTNDSDFPQNTDRLLKGNGILDSDEISSLSGSPTHTLTASGGTEDFITIFVQQPDSHQTDHNANCFIEFIEIVGLENNTFDSNQILSAKEGSGDKEHGTFTVTPTFLGIPTFESQVPPEFTTASNIAYTVIGIVPVALFFFLFAIFSPRVE